MLLWSKGLNHDSLITWSVSMDSKGSLFGLVLYVPVNSYGHVGTVSSLNPTFFPGQV